MENEIKRIVMTAGAQSGNVRRVTAQAQDINGNPVKAAWRARFAVCNEGDLDAYSTNATIAAVSGSSTSEWVHQANKDLTLIADNAEGELDFDVTDAETETVTAYSGPSPRGGVSADYSQSLDLDFE